MTTDNWPAIIDALLERAPYDGRGGRAVLAHALGVSVVTLKSWSSGTRVPNNRNRAVIRRLAGKGGE